MIRLNVSLIVEDSSRVKPLVETATELVEFSLRDKGVIDYDFFKSTTNDDRYMIYETWENEEALKRHQETEHFKRLVPRLQDLATLTTEKFDF